MDFGILQNKVKLLFHVIAKPDYILNNYYVDSLLNKLNSDDAGKFYLLCTQNIKAIYQLQRSHQSQDIQHFITVNVSQPHFTWGMLNAIHSYYEIYTFYCL